MKSPEVRVLPRIVVGFFAGNSTYSHSSSNYRFFFSKALSGASQSGLKYEIGGCFYRKEGYGVSPILGSLGRIFRDFLFSNDFVSFTQKIEKDNRQDGKVTIGYSRID